jgi:CMP-N,N'-diacetyllegionaminic acid synthase
MIVAMIPARQGSTGIPLKNVKMLDGIPLIMHTVKAAVESNVDLVVVTTESDMIIMTVLEWMDKLDLPVDKVRIQRRPEPLAQGHVQTNEVFLYSLRQLQLGGINPDTLVLLQPTSPFRTSQHINEALDLYNEWTKEGLHTVIAGYPADGFYWKLDWDGLTEPVHHDPVRRYGRQWINKHDKLYREAGSIYLTDRVRFEMTGTYRLAPFVMYEMTEQDSIDLDSPDDWIRAEQEVIRRQNADKC